MPCRYYGPGEYEAIQLADQSALAREYRLELDRLSALLCRACKSADEAALPADVRAWWVQHQKDDDAAAEAARLESIERERAKAAKVAQEQREREADIAELEARLAKLREVK